MKNIKIFISVFSVVLILCCVQTSFAYGGGMSTEEMPKDEQESLIENICINVFETEPKKRPITCFDVNENGLIALGTEYYEQKTISIYTSKGEFLYGLSFNDDGAFGVEWENENLNIYLVRSELKITVDKAGQIKAVFKIKDTLENNSYWNNFIFSDTRNINGIEYKIDNDLGIINLIQSSYSRLVVTTPQGAETVLYDVGSSQLLYSIFWIIAVVLIVTIAITAIAKQWKKNIKEQNKNDELINSIMKNAFDNSKSGDCPNEKDF